MTSTISTSNLLAQAEEHLQNARYDAAESTFRLAIGRDPANAQAHGGLGDSFHARGKLGQAIAAYRQALELDSESTRAWWGIGSAFAAGNEHAAAMECFERLTELLPHAPEPRHNLGKALFALGDVEGALKAFRKADALSPNPLSTGMIAVLIPGSPSASLQDILDARTHWARTLPTMARPLPRENRERIRVGYVSSFLSQPNWMKPVWALINNHDRDRFEVFLFSDAPEYAIGPEYRRNPSGRFHNIQEQSNEQAAGLIREQEIDILVDLNAFSKFERLPLFALRPAPLLVQWFALFATSGMTCFDALIGDDQVILPGEESFFSEPLVALRECYMTFEVAYPVPDVVAPPSLSGKPFTFGCLAPQYKITPEVMRGWGAIMSQSPASRLILKSTALGSEGTRMYVRDQLEKAGVDPARVELRGPSPHYAFLETYNEIDAVLDTHPYNGGTTTTEAIWQGVPVLTFAGDRWVSRISATILRHGGLGEFVAPDLQAHIAQAVAIANDPRSPTNLASLRGALRDRLNRSSVCDGRGFAGSMESIYQQLIEKSDRLS